MSIYTPTATTLTTALGDVRVTINPTSFVVNAESITVNRVNISGYAIFEYNHATGELKPSSAYGANTFDRIDRPRPASVAATRQTMHVLEQALTQFLTTDTFGELYTAARHDSTRRDRERLEAQLAKAEAEVARLREELAAL